MSTQQLPDKLKLIWDFRGPAAHKTAEHHEEHLKEYIQMEKTEFEITGIEKLNEMHTLVFMVIAKEEMEKIKLALKPQRAQAWE